MVEVTIDGQKVEVPEGSMVMHAANALGVYVPHFCYHKKLSIAANCRMCLVEVEKAPKPLPACATPVTQGMIVYTKSEKAVKAQKSVMEFLLINHPLDCPICDQGGECQLQDLAVGYGGSASRYAEEKRVVFHKDLGPLVSAEEMSRCIHCTRCVRFGQEIAGVMELGMLNRGEHSEITSFVGRAIESELSGNMIDICPVGALTSKPFRYSARTWELARRRSVSPHDSVGANLVVQVKNNQVMRVVPFENESVNECWISDRDRFAYEGLNSEDRLTRPMLRDPDGSWREADWQEALEFVATELTRIRAEQGGQQIAALASPMASLEELGLLGMLTRALGSENIDSRLQRSDPGLESAFGGAPWLGMSLPEFSQLDRVLVIGSFLRKDHPLLAQRLRLAARRGTKLSLLHVSLDDPLIPQALQHAVVPSAFESTLAEVLVAALDAVQHPRPAGFESIQPSEVSVQIAQSLVGGERVGIFLGNYAMAHPRASALARLAQALANALGGRVGVLGESGNSVGAALVGAIPTEMGLTARQIVADTPAAVLALHLEPAFDLPEGRVAETALSRARLGVALTAYRSAAAAWAKVMLPIAPYTETSGSYLNVAGELQTVQATVKPRGEARPAWKVLRVLANLCALPGFEYDSTDAVRTAILARHPVAAGLSKGVRGELEVPQPVAVPAGAVERVADLPIYRSDAIVRRAESLQNAPASLVTELRLHPQTASALGLADAKVARVRGVGQAWRLSVDAAVVPGTVRIPLALEQTVMLASAHGAIELERV